MMKNRNQQSVSTFIQEQTTELFMLDLLVWPSISSLSWLDNINDSMRYIRDGNKYNDLNTPLLNSRAYRSSGGMWKCERTLEVEESICDDLSRASVLLISTINSFKSSRSKM